MNERIREIADQILPNEKKFHQGNPKEWGYFFSGDELEKFAELIVLECLALADNTRDGCEQDGEDQQALGADWVGLAIARHFGVEE